MISVNNDSMPAVSTPSITQQRIILIVFLLVISALVWWQNAGGGSNHPVQKFSQTPVPDAVAELDFTSAEDSWNGLRIDPRGNLKIDARTQSALVDAIALLHDQNSELEMARIALLLEKQFGATTTQQIMELVPILKDYQEAEKRWWEENGSSNLSANKPPAYAELFQLQDEVLGETLATKLFSEQRRLTRMMVASHQIRNDASLTQAQKDQLLMDLQTRFKDSYQEGVPIEPDF